MKTRVAKAGEYWTVIFEHPNGRGVRCSTREFRDAVAFATSPAVRQVFTERMEHATAWSTDPAAAPWMHKYEQPPIGAA